MTARIDWAGGEKINNPLVECDHTVYRLLGHSPASYPLASAPSPTQLVGIDFTGGPPVVILFTLVPFHVGMGLVGKRR